MLDHMVADDIAQRICVPPPTTQKCLLTPWAAIDRSLGTHPTRLARLVAKQRVEELVRRHGDTALYKQRADALLGISQRTYP